MNRRVFNAVGNLGKWRTKVFYYFGRPGTLCEMKPAALIFVVSFAAGAGLVRLAIPVESGGRAEPAPEQTSGEAEGFEREANYEAVEASDLPFDGADIELTGDGNRWHVGYRGPSGKVRPTTDLAPDGTTAVRLPANSRVRLTLTSRDYVYMLALPKIDQSQVAVPGREFRLEFRTQAPGAFALRGSHVCGPPSRALDVTVRVEPKPDFEAWLADIRDRQPKENP